MSKRNIKQTQTVLKVEHLSMIFGGLVAVDDVSFSAERNKITAIIGPNGAGKTTVFNCLTGFYSPSIGRLTLTHDDGKEFFLERLYAHECAHIAKVARTFQNIRLFPAMTVLENLLVAQHHKLMRASGYTVGGLLGLPSYKAGIKEAVDKAQHIMEVFDIIEFADDEAGSLAYGTQRRVEIARSACTDPAILCLDEPAAGLNPRESASLNDLLVKLVEDFGLTVLLIEHDMSVVMKISDHIIVLDYGKLISEGDPKQIKNDKKVIAAYLGQEIEV